MHVREYVHLCVCVHVYVCARAKMCMWVMPMYGSVCACVLVCVTLYSCTLLHCAGDIAWDWINDKLYWTDFLEQEIEVYDFNNAYRRVILYTGSTSSPLGIAVDPQNG